MTKSKTIFVPAKFEPNYVEEVVKIPTGETTKTFFGMITKHEVRRERQMRQDGYSTCAIDGEKLAHDVSKAISEKERDGYRVFSIVPITSGNWSYEKGVVSGGGGGTGPGGRIDSIHADLGYSMGWSFTSGMVITFTND
jgi:hypothetical protein